MGKIRLKMAAGVLGPIGRMISGSKGNYQHNNPDNLVVFNANLIFKNKASKLEKIWYGDLDLTLDESLLHTLSKILDAGTLYILAEHGARFENEKKPKIDNAVASLTNGTFELSVNHTQFYERDKAGLLVKIKAVPISEAAQLAKIKKVKESFKKEDYTVIDLNAVTEDGYLNFSDFSKSLSDSQSPLHNFYDMLKPAAGLTTDNVYKVILTEDDYALFKKQFEYWLRIFISPHSSEYRIKQEVELGWFSYGPNSFQHTPDWAEDGFIYLKK